MSCSSPTTPDRSAGPSGRTGRARARRPRAARLTGWTRTSVRPPIAWPRHSRSEAGRGTDPRVRTPFRTNYDVSISKNIAIFGGLNADIRAEMLTATNSPKFVGPETRLGTAQFG